MTVELADLQAANRDMELLIERMREKHEILELQLSLEKKMRRSLETMMHEHEVSSKRRVEELEREKARLLQNVRALSGVVSADAQRKLVAKSNDSKGGVRFLSASSSSVPTTTTSSSSSSHSSSSAPTATTAMAASLTRIPHNKL
jgi:hypothetical protein